MKYNRLLFLPLLLISASIFSGQNYRDYPTPPDCDPPPYHELPQYDPDESGKEDTPKKTIKKSRGCISRKKVRCAGLTTILLLAAAGFVPEMAISYENQSMVQFSASPINAHDSYPISGPYCITERINCTPEENEDFEQICSRFDQSNTTAKQTKRIVGPPGGRIKNKPRSCKKACNKVSNGKECVKAAIKNGAIAYKECHIQKTHNDVINNSGIASVLMRFLTVGATVVVLFAECTG